MKETMNENNRTRMLYINEKRKKKNEKVKRGTCHYHHHRHHRNDNEKGGEGMRRDENESSHRLVDRVYGYDIITMHIHTYIHTYIHVFFCFGSQSQSQSR